MLKYYVTAVCILSVFCVQAQIQPVAQDTTEIQQDSIRKLKLTKQLGNGYFPTKYFDIDLRYLIKFNQYEGLRTGLGGITNDGFSEKFRLTSYLVYGFVDHRFKYSIGGGVRLIPESNTWLNVFYTDDLQETGSSKFLTDSRFFQFFEPRLLNIDLFYKYIAQTVSLEHQINPNLITELQFEVTNINPTYDYVFQVEENAYREVDLSTGTFSMQWSPFSSYKLIENKLKETNEGFPKFAFQLTQSFKGIFHGDLYFTKIDFRTLHKVKHNEESFSFLELTSGIATGRAPLSHLYHAYPNNINKETILQRFSVAGINSFETMYFNEFFSDKFVTLQLRHYLKPFQISSRLKPQLVLITRFAIGDMSHIERHQGITFGTLDKGYTESGFEINKLLFGFGLSGTYRYGAYYLPRFEDNIAIKFTFNITL